MLEIAIRSIQHYMYCPHRWGLLEIDKAWAENIFVTKACLMHKRVHDPDRHYSTKSKKVYTSVPVYNDKPEYNLYGVTDCIELTSSDNGVFMDDSKHRYKITIVEYKPTMPKHSEYNEDDLMQVFAQKICVDYIFNCDCDTVIYYADKKKRIHLKLRDNYDRYNFYLKSLLEEMRKNFENGKIPPIRKGQKCSGCSMKDICMPSIKKSINTQKLIESINKEYMQE